MLTILLSLIIAFSYAVYMAKKTKQPVVMYGCLPGIGIAILIVAFVMILTGGNEKKIDFSGEALKPDVVVKDFCTLNIAELESKYGKSTDDFSDPKTRVYNWTLNKESGMKVMLFETNGNREVARFFKLDLGTFFWEALGWELGNIDTNKFEQADYVRNLGGIDEAVYKHKLELLDIKLSGDISNFGKKVH